MLLGSTNVSLYNTCMLLGTTNSSLYNTCTLLGVTNSSLYSVSLSLDMTTGIANTNTASIGNLWSYAESVSMTAWDAYADVQTIMQNIGNIQDNNLND